MDNKKRIKFEEVLLTLGIANEEWLEHLELIKTVPLSSSCALLEDKQ
jgi:hypothetical protein